MKKIIFSVILCVLFMLIYSGCGQVGDEASARTQVSSEIQAGTQVGGENQAATTMENTNNEEAATQNTTATTQEVSNTQEQTAAISSALGSKLTVGAHYYPWYGPQNHWGEGDLRRKLEPAQSPFLGLYNSGDPKVNEQHIQWAKDYGVDYFLMSWWGAGPDKFEDNNIKNGFLKAKNISDIKFGILYETPGRLGGLVNNTINFNENSKKMLKKDLAYLAETYFNHPSYLKFEGKPVVYFYLSRCFGGDYVKVIQEVREEIKKEYGMELFLIGDEIYWGQTYLADEKLKCLDAFSIYNPHNNDSFAGEYMEKFDESSAISKLYNDALENAKSGKTHFIPDAMPGFNDRGRRLEAGHNSIPREMNKGEEGSESTFREFLELAYKYRDPGLNTILITSWNEWHEDSQIEPTKTEGSITSKPDDLTEGYSYAPYGLKDLEILKAFKDKYSNQK